MDNRIMLMSSCETICDPLYDGAVVGLQTLVETGDVTKAKEAMRDTVKNWDANIAALDKDIAETFGKKV